MVDPRCGFLCIKGHPKLQKCANLKVYSFVAGLCILAVTGAYSYMSAVMSTTQSVYSFNATESGVWYAMFEVGSVLANVFASFFLTRKHIPRVLTIGLIMVSAGCIAHGLPHFLVSYEDQLRTVSEEVTADNHFSAALCQNSSGNFSDYDYYDDYINPVRSATVITLYCIAGFIMGAGYAPFWSLGLVYIDNNVEDVHDSSTYIAIILAFYTIGPVAGFGAGGLFLSKYVTFGETYLTPEDSQWIGAWWVGYLLFGGLLALLVIPLSMFPRELPMTGTQSVDDSAAQHKKLSIVSNSSVSSTADILPTERRGQGDKQELRKLSELLPTLWRLLKNPLWLAECLGSCAACYFMAGWLGYLPKYFEVQFNQTAWTANLSAGLPAPACACFGIFGGGWLATKKKFTLQQDAKMLFFSCVFSTLLCIPLIFLHCHQYPIQEAPAQYSSCVQDCGCSEYVFDPVCSEGVSYKSPCLAGCNGFTELDDGTVEYTGCFCNDTLTVQGGLCWDDDCLAPYFYVVFAVLSFTVFTLSSSAGVNVIIRCVPEDDKSLALGIQSSLNSLLAWIPGPIMFGTIIDSTCLTWEYPGGSEEDPDWWGYCQEYDNEAFRLKFTAITIGMQVVTTLFCGLGWILSRMDRYQTYAASPETMQEYDTSQTADYKAEVDMEEME